MPIYSPSYVEQLVASAWSLTCLQQDKGLKASSQDQAHQTLFEKNRGAKKATQK